MIQKRYEGFINTSFLWENDSIFNLTQFEINSKSIRFELAIDDNLRLGKYIERFVSFELQQQDDISILAENIQIQEGKHTLGELDCLLLMKNQPIHLEIIYKFYLYDDTVGETEIDHFIGPNRKDSLIEKLTKLKEKQLPLLYSETCKDYLDKFNLKAENIIQRVYFKAQLFVPFSSQDLELRTLNTYCIVGYFIKKRELGYFKTCKFYIPNKKDWLVIPDPDVDWMNFELFKEKTEVYFTQKFSTMCWVKFKNGTIKKVFLVWW
jgi:hypothetical protein